MDSKAVINETIDDIIKDMERLKEAVSKLDSKSKDKICQGCADKTSEIMMLKRK